MIAPGDFCVTRIAGAGGALIAGAEWLATGGPGKHAPVLPYDHAFIYTGYLSGRIAGRDYVQRLESHGWTQPGHYAAEAEPHGARLRYLGATAEEAFRFVLAADSSALWSNRRLFPRDAQRDKIVRYALLGLGTPYSWLDYLSIGAHHAHLNVPGLDRYIASTGHMICSQYVDWAWNRAGFEIFDDDRWEGDVMPLDLAMELLPAPA